MGGGAVSDGILARNLDAAAQARPRVRAGESFANEILREPDSEKYIPEDCVNGEKTVRALLNGSFVYVHSKYDPSGTAAKLAETVSADKNGGVLVICGMGFGYEVRECLKNIGPDNMLAVCEPDFGLLRHAFRNVDLSDILLDGRVWLIVGAEELDAAFREIFTLENIEKAVLVRTPVYWRLFGNELDAARGALINVANYYTILKNSIVSLSELWHLSHFKNWKTVAGSYLIDNFFGVLEGKPAVLVSAGPSLNKNAGLLGEIKGKAFILCVYTALKVLDNLGVRPDMVISLDGKQIIYADYRNFEFDMPLIFCNTINPEVFKTHKGKTVAAMTGNDAFMTGVLSELGVAAEPVQTGESVACAAVDILCKMGADPVIFIGQDFAYSDGKNHADGTFYDGKNGADDVPGRKFPVEGWDGGQALTDDMWFVYLEWFRRYIQEDGGRRAFINATEGGAMIKGAERMTFREAIDRYVDPGYGVEAALEAGFAKGVLLDAAQTRKLTDKLARVRADLERCLEPLREGIRLSERLEEAYGASDWPDPKAVEGILCEFRKIDDILDEIKDSAPIMDVLFMRSTFELNFRRPEGMSEGAYAAKRSLILYKSLLNAAEFTLPLIGGTIEDLKGLEMGKGGLAWASD